MESIHYYHDYLDKCYNTIESLDKELHNCYVRRNNLANICYANINILESNGITKELIDALILGIRLKNIHLLRKFTCEDSAKAVSLRITINKLLYISLVRIPKLLAIIRYYDWMCRIPYPIFNQIQRSFNKSLIENLIRGTSVSLGTYIGKFEIQRAIARDSIDWAASFKLKSELLEKGVKVRSLFNPDGVDWKIKSDNPFYWFCKWIRMSPNVAVIPNQIFYKFKPISCHANIKTSEKVTKHKSIEEIIKAENIAFDAKLKYIIAHDKDIHNRYPATKCKRERIKNNEIDEYIRPKSN